MLTLASDSSRAEAARPIEDVDHPHLALVGDPDARALQLRACARDDVVVDEQVDDAAALAGEPASPRMFTPAVPVTSPSRASSPGVSRRITVRSVAIAR